ncbi:MAG: class I SAM-dependent methyltransferase [Candidatus Andersenbacteria bacterium]|nr:class I SAM-dependent methyltransferase [Candidatus Andersenbacteria bacterium]
MDVREAYAHYLSTHFGRAGRQEDDNFIFQERYFKKNYLPYLPKDRNARIVDLGTGLGHVLFFLQRAGYKNILGVDVGHEVIEFCRAHKFPVVEEEIITWLATQKETIDAIVLNDVLEHQTKPEMWAMLEAMRDALKPGGAVLIKVPNMGNPLLGNDSRYLDITHQNGFNENSLRQALFMAKYKKVDVIGPDIYVTANPVVNVVCRAVAGLLDGIFYLVFRFYGRTETKIFRKNILAIAHK